MVRQAGGKDLCFGFQTAEGAGVDDTVTIALEGVAVGMIRLGIAPAAARVNGETEALQHECRATVPVVRRLRKWRLGSPHRSACGAVRASYAPHPAGWG